VPKESVKGGCSEHVVTSLACQHTFSDRAAEKLSPDQAIEGPVGKSTSLLGRGIPDTVELRRARFGCKIWV